MSFTELAQRVEYGDIDKHSRLSLNKHNKKKKKKIHTTNNNTN